MDPSPFECTLEPGPPLGDCSECVDEKCSDLLPYCEADAACACLVDCVRQNGIVGVNDCLVELDLVARPVGFVQLEECVAVACPDSDECATPADWVPPSSEFECDGAGSGGIGSGSGADCGFDPTLPFQADGEVLQLESPDGQVCVRLVRRNEGVGSLANTEWTLLEAQIGPLGEVADVTIASDLCWYASHHNFRDWAHIWTGTRHYDLVLLQDGHGGALRYHLYAFEEGPLDGASCAPTADGTRCLDGPIVLVAHEP